MVLPGKQTAHGTLWTPTRQKHQHSMSGLSVKTMSHHLSHRQRQSVELFADHCQECIVWMTACARNSNLLLPKLVEVSGWAPPANREKIPMTRTCCRARSWPKITFSGSFLHPSAIVLLCLSSRVSTRTLCKARGKRMFICSTARSVQWQEAGRLHLACP